MKSKIASSSMVRGRQIYIAAIIKQGKNGFFDISCFLAKPSYPNKNNTISHEEHIKTSKQQEGDNVLPLGLLY